MSQAAWEQGECYKIEAWWPVANQDPLVEYVTELSYGIPRVLALAWTGRHTAISLITPNRLEIIKMWGQLDGLP